MPPGEFAQPVAGGVGTGGYRKVFEVPPQILGQVRGRQVTPLRLLAQRHGKDIVEIVAARCGLPARGGQLGKTARHLTCPRRLHLADHPFELGKTPTVEFVRPTAGHQLVEDHPQRIHITRRRQIFAAHLLGARKFRRQKQVTGFRQRRAFGQDRSGCLAF